ncbi:MAG: TonB-dependent receptor [Acidobacteria bacterium]|nr:TonB-dependent receptor [Acidobacteriota bacterium]
MRGAWRPVLWLLALVGLALVPTAPARAQAAAGSLRVIVKDRDFEVPLTGARVAIVEALLTLETGDDGNCLFPTVPAGSYTVTIAKPGYERQVRTGVVVTPDRLAELEVLIAAEVIELEELVVTGFDPLANSELGLLEIRATALQVQDAISSELISRAGASDVAGALKLVVGASIVDGKYATVRGLSDRYTGTTVNGVRVPSADPRKRAVQVDLFPSGTLDSVTVTKTFTPDLQGDFTGGGVDIRTKSVPEERILSASVSTEYDENATGNTGFLTYRNGGVDRLGFSSDDSRELPDYDFASLPSPSTSTPRPSPAAQAVNNELDRFTDLFEPVMGTSRQAPEWNHGFSFTAGNTFRTEKNRKLGLLGALTYSHSYDFYDGAVNDRLGVQEGAGVNALALREDSQGTDEILLGFLGSAEFRPVENHGISLKVIANQAAEDKARLQFENRTAGNTSYIINQSLRYTERTVVSVQVHGDHALDELFAFGKGTQSLHVNWVGSANYTRQDEPDVRFFRYNFDERSQNASRAINSTDTQHFQRIFSDIEERNEQFAANVAFKFLQWNELEAEIKVGGHFEESDREFSDLKFAYVFHPQTTSSRPINSPAYTLAYPGELWSDVFTDPDRLGLATSTLCRPGQTTRCSNPNQLLYYLTTLADREQASYFAKQRITGTYAMATLPFTKRLKTIFGARYETTDISIDPYNSLDPENGQLFIIIQDADGNRLKQDARREDVQSSISEDRLLPAASFIYELKPQMNVRASWSKTIARPTFRELAPAATAEFLFGDQFFGNSDLELSDIENYDLRWEWFPRPGDVLAASVFYKDIENPIEYISFVVSSDPFIQPVNYETGSLRGVEIEARSGLDVFWKRLEGFAASINATVLDSEVEVPESEQQSLSAYGLDEESRRLLGQPEFIVNAALTYDNEEWGTSAGLFYNIIGETLISGAARGDTEGVPNFIESEFANLDFTFQQKVAKGFSISGRARNLLAEERESVGRIPTGEERLRTSRETATRYSISLSYKW